jgi:PAS domain-containing protein
MLDDNPPFRRRTTAPAETRAMPEQQHAEENLRDRKQRLRQSEESLRRLIDAIPQIVWTNNADGTTNYFNSRWYEYTGLNYEQSAGPSWQAVIHPDDASMAGRSQDWPKCLSANTGCATPPENTAGSSGGLCRCAIIIAFPRSLARATSVEMP